MSNQFEERVVKIKVIGVGGAGNNAVNRMIEEGIGEYANPSSIMRAVGMLLSHIGLQKESDKLSRALDICMFEEKKVVNTGNKDGATCAQFADYIMETVKSL